MTLFFELSGPWQWRPWLYHSDTMVRFGWALMAAGWLREPFVDFATAPHGWEGLA